MSSSFTPRTRELADGRTMNALTYLVKDAETVRIRFSKLITIDVPVTALTLSGTTYYVRWQEDGNRATMLQGAFQVDQIHSIIVRPATHGFLNIEIEVY